jgi:hypothetical protein
MVPFLAIYSSPLQEKHVAKYYGPIPIAVAEDRTVVLPTNSASITTEPTYGEFEIFTTP